MGQKEYLMFRIIAGINDPSSVDKLLSIPQADFNLEEVHRVAVACEAAKNYSGLISPKTLPTKSLATNHSTTLLHQTILKIPIMITIHFLEQQKSNFLGKTKNVSGVVRICTQRTPHALTRILPVTNVES